MQPLQLQKLLKHYRTLRRRLFDALIKPLTIDTENYRRELIANVILAVLSFAAAIALLLSIQYHLIHDSGNESSIVIGAIFLSVMLGSWRLSRRGHYRISAYILVGLMGLVTIQMALNYSYELPATPLLYSLTLVVAGILLSNRALLTMTFALAVFMIGSGYAQLTGRLHPYLGWRSENLQLGDAIGFSTVLIIIGIVSWLANRTIDSSFKRAKDSETALEAERDSLEIKVIERTRALEEMQLLRTLELQRFAEFGRLSANLVHEVANPLTAASLNLEQLAGNQSEVVSQIKLNLKHVERYVVAARKQLQQESTQVRFSVKAEMAQITRLLAPLARANQIALNVDQSGNFWLHGDPVKFNQLVGNLVVNAVDAYKASTDNRLERAIEVHITGNKSWVTITVVDHGTGISKVQLEHIFEPFYTTKSANNRGLGIGLTMVKQFAETEFHGSITASSSAAGTKFVAKLKRSHA